MRILSFLKFKKKSEPNRVRKKRIIVDVITPDQKRIKREDAYEKRLHDRTENRRSYGTKH